MKRFCCVIAALLLTTSAFAGPPPFVSALPNKQPLIQESSWQTSIPFWGMPHVSQAVGSTVLTFGEDFAVDGTFSAVQLVFQNTGSYVQTLGAVDVSSSASYSKIVTPVDANGTALTWIPVTVNGSTSITLPAASTTVQPSLTLSDIIPMKSLARTDGGTKSLIFTRYLSPAAGQKFDTGIMSGAAFFTQYANDSGGRSVQAYFGGGDFVSTNQKRLTDTNAAIGNLYNYVVGVRFLSSTRSVTIMGAGDSLTTGLKTRSGYNGFGLQATVRLAKSTGLSFNYEAHGYPAQHSTDFVASAIALINLAPPNVLTVTIDSPNDYTGVTGAANIAATRLAMQTRIMSLVDYAQSKGIMVALLSPIPFATYDTVANYGIDRVKSGDFVRHLTVRDMVVVDAQTIISGFMPTQTNLPILPLRDVADDGAHLSDVAQGYIATVLAQKLMPYLN